MIGAQRRSLLQAGAALLCARTLPAEVQKADGRPAFQFMVKDLVYQRHGNKQRLARLYQSAGTGPFPSNLPS
jgi:hypothetical protein